MNVGALFWMALVAQVDDDLGGGAPLAGPSAADLGALQDEGSDELVPVARPTRSHPTAKLASGPDATFSALRPGGQVSALRPGGQIPKVGTDADEGKANKLRADLEAGLLDLSDDKRGLMGRLETLASTSVPEGVVNAEPRLKPLLKLVRARAHLVAGRYDDADAALKDARAAFDAIQLSLEEPQARRLLAALRFQAAAVQEGRVRGELFVPGCGGTLGLKRLADDEARHRRELLEGVAARFGPIAQGPDRLWGRRAAFQVAALYDDVARHGLVAPSFRSVALPSPYAVDIGSTGLVLDPLISGWLGEIRRAYGELMAAVDVREPDAELVERLRDRAAALALVTAPASEPVKNPWAKELHEGVLRVARRPQRRNGAGRFVPTETKAGIAALAAAVQKGPGTVDQAYALVGLAEIAPEKVRASDVVAALLHSDDRVVVAGLIAAERVAAGSGGAEKAAILREPVTVTLTAAAVDPKSKPFSSLQATLFSRVERAVLALAAIAKADRAGAELIVADDRIPAVERAWMIAELADPRFALRFDTWAWDRDERVAALAVWGGVVARGKHASYLLRPAAEGLVGCVSRAASTN